MDPGSIARILKRAVRAAGMDDVEFSGHSMRAGMITSAAEAGKPEWAIARHTGHTSNSLRRYIRADLFTQNPLQGLGL